MKLDRVIPLGLLLSVTLGPSTLLAHEEKDPVCGMMVEVEKAHGKSAFAGLTYYF